MPIPPKPTKVTCAACGWSRVIVHSSDVISLPSACEHCGSEDLRLTAAGALEGALAKVASDLRRIRPGS